MEAALHESMADDPCKKAYATICIVRDISRSTTKLRELIEGISPSIGEENSGLLRVELKNFEWERKFALETTIEMKLRPPNISLDPTAIINLTDVGIPNDIQMALSWGPRFVFPNNNFDLLDIIPDIDAIVTNRLPDLKQDQARKLSSIRISKFNEEGGYVNTVESWLNFLAQRSTDFFKHNSHLIVVNSDKGKHTVIMLKRAYEQKVEDLLSDTNTYRIVANSCNENIDKNEAFVDRLVQLGVVDKSKRFRLSDKSAIPAKFYGLPKIHKGNAPLRPITSAFEAPGKNLAEFLVQTLSAFFDDENLHVKNTAEFKEFIDKVRIEPDEILVSFDVVSMFTNIPVDLAIEVIRKKKRIIEKRTKIPFELLEEMLRFVMSDCAQFTYKTATYSQVHGIGMGSAISPLIAKIVMSDLMATQLPKLPQQPNFIRVYVDDTACCVKRTLVNEMLHTLNDYHCGIQFTMEMETDGRINFLDITLIRNGSNIMTNWYKKPFASNRLLNYLSSHKRSTIVNVAKAHIVTILKLSDGEFFQENREHIVNRLRLNNFPEIEIMRLMNENYSMMRVAPKRIILNTKYGAMTQIDGLTKGIAQDIKLLDPELAITGRPNRINGNFWSQLKDRTEPELRPNMIVDIVCNCRQAAIIDHTRYKERLSSLVDRTMSTFSFSEAACDRTHNFSLDKIMYTKGSSTAQKTRLKCEVRAAASNKKILNKLQGIEPRWRKLIKKKRSHKRN